MLMMVISRVVLAFSLVLVGVPVGAQEAAPPRPEGPLASLRQLDEGFVALFNQVAPSVVVIDASRKRAAGPEGGAFDFFHAPEENARPPFRLPEPADRSEGSGIIFSAEGYIATNQHVIDGAEKLTVRLKDGRRFPATVVGADTRTDIAVIKIEAAGLPVAQFGDSDALRIGQVVGAIGVPFALDYSFTIGIVSGKGRAGFTQLTYEDYIQTDAAINQGNSGGPLFDVEGRVVGMNAFINGIGRGLAFAIPSNTLREVTSELVASGRVRRPWLGIRIETLEGESSLRDQIKGIEEGVVVNTIEPDAPAYRSDLRPADVITAFNGVPVKSMRELQKQVLATKVGQKVNLSIWRNGKTLTVAVTTGELPEPGGGTATARPPEAEGGGGTSVESYGLQLEDAPAQAGALVAIVEPASPAAVADLQPGDVITEIDSRPVKSAAEAQKLLSQDAKRKARLLFMQRNGQKTYAVLKIEQ